MQASRHKSSSQANAALAPKSFWQSSLAAITCKPKRGVFAGSGYGTGSQRGNTGSEEARNMTYEGSTASGARSGRTGATGVMDQGTGSGTGTGTGSGVGTGRSATTGTGNTGSRSTGATTGGVSEGFRGLNLTGSSGVCCSSQLLEPLL